MSVIKYKKDGKWYTTQYGEQSVPTKLSELSNDVGFITKDDVPECEQKNEVFVQSEEPDNVPDGTLWLNTSKNLPSSNIPAWAKQPEKPTYTAEEVGALAIDTEIPSKTSDLENDSGFITSEALENISGNDTRIYIQDEEPVDAPVGTIWYDTDDELPKDKKLVTEAMMQEYIAESVGNLSADEINCDVEIDGTTHTKVDTALEVLANRSGGGSSEKEWVCLMNTTFEEDTQTFEVTKDINGNDFSVDELFMKIYVVNPHGGGGLVFYLNKAQYPTQLMNQNFFAQRAQSYGTVNIFKKANMWYLGWANSHESTQGGWSVLYHGVPVESAPTITSFRITTTSENSFFAVGSKIEIWGLKA